MGITMGTRQLGVRRTTQGDIDSRLARPRNWETHGIPQEWDYEEVSQVIAGGASKEFSLESKLRKKGKTAWAFRAVCGDTADMVEVICNGETCVAVDSQKSRKRMVIDSRELPCE